MSLTFISNDIKIQSYLKSGDVSTFYLILQVNVISNNTQNKIPWFLQLGQTNPTNGAFQPYYKLSGFNLDEIGGTASYLAYFSVLNNYPIIATLNQSTGVLLVNNFPQFTFDFTQIDTCRVGSEIYNEGSVSSTQLYQITIVEIEKYTYGCAQYPQFVCPSGLSRPTSTSLPNPRDIVALAKANPETIQLKQGEAIQYSNSTKGSPFWFIIGVLALLIAAGITAFVIIKRKKNKINH